LTKTVGATGRQEAPRVTRADALPVGVDGWRAWTLGMWLRRAGAYLELDNVN